MITGSTPVDPEFAAFLPWIPWGVALLDICLLLPIAAYILALRGLFESRDRQLVDVFLLRKDVHGTLYRVIDCLSRRIGTRPPDAVVLSPFTGAWIGDGFKIWEGTAWSRHGRVLLLGAEDVIKLRADEFAALISHELAHAASGDLWFSKLFGKFYHSVTDTLVRILRSANFIDRAIVLPLKAYYRILLRLFLVHSQEREFAADYRSARLGGRRNLRQALIKSSLTTYLPRLDIRHILSELVHSEGDTINLYEEYRVRWSRLRIGELEQAKSRLLSEPAEPGSRHPPLSERLERVSQVTGSEFVVDKPATELFHAWEGLEAKISDDLLAKAREWHGSALPSVSPSA